MLKSIIVGVWVIAVTLGALFLALPKEDKVEKVAQKILPLSTFKTENLAVAVFKEGKIVGYLTAQIECKILNSDMEAKVLWIATDALHRAIYKGLVGDVLAPNQAELNAVAAFVEAQVNARFGEIVVSQVVLADVRFLDIAK